MPCGPRSTRRRRPGDLRDLARQMREAVVDAKVAVQEMRAALARTELELTAEGQRLADAERRGRLAAEIQDQETVQVAERFTARHRERVGVLERKLAAQREELALAERDLGRDAGAARRPPIATGRPERGEQCGARLAGHPGRGRRAGRTWTCRTSSSRPTSTAWPVSRRRTSSSIS